MPEDLSAPLLLKLQARFFLILPDIRYIRQQGYPELFANIDMNLYPKIFPLPFSANFKKDSFNLKILSTGYPATRLSGTFCED